MIITDVIHWKLRLGGLSLPTNN